MNRVEELYLSAFPANERFPFRLLKKRALQGKADFSLFSTAIPLSLNTAGRGSSTSLLSKYSTLRSIFFQEVFAATAILLLPL